MPWVQVAVDLPERLSLVVVDLLLTLHTLTLVFLSEFTPGNPQDLAHLV